MSSESSNPKPTFGYDPYNDPFKYPCSCAIPPVLEHTTPPPLTDYTPYLPDWMYPNGSEEQPFEITEQVLEAIERNNRIAEQLSPVLKYIVCWNTRFVKLRKAYHFRNPTPRFEDYANVLGMQMLPGYSCTTFSPKSAISSGKAPVVNEAAYVEA
ncbi:unnamed protein product [Haemonchus placei]|uniref:Uncharacterized protein n=1 Tax=Haemonchus placei TaxID=6290 RepID=A0A0N4WPL1_HAEPC|nr:unnamed protein product [Haemonchus placei]